MADFADNRLPEHGLDAEAVLARLDDLAADDRDWRGGRVFSLVYNAGDDVLDLLSRAAARYSAENALNTMAFPSLGWMQHDIVTITAGLLGADRRPAGTGPARGYLTSGGTESLLQATKTARDWGRAERGVTRPNMVLATSGHAAFDKAAHYFDVRARRVPVRPDGAADVAAMADAVDDDTVLVIGSAPSYPQGVSDPITDLAALGHVTTPWDLAVPGVTSISADLHKYGYASKGVSVILYGDAALARLQPFVPSNWLGGLYGSPSMAGTRPGGPIAAGPGTGHRGRAVEAAQPVRRHEGLEAGQSGVAVEDDRHALGRVSVLVKVGTDRRHPGNRQVPRSRDVPEGGVDQQEEPPEAGVDVAQDATLGGQGAEVGDRVDDPLGVGGCRADHEHGVVVHRVGHGPHVGRPVRSHRHAAGLHAEVVGRLVERGMATGGEHHVGAGHAPLGPTPVAGGLGGLEERLGAPRREVAPDAAAPGRPPIGPQQAGGDGHDVVLHPSE